MNIEKQELYCHSCVKYVQFELDMELNGNHVITCPNCYHKHCRVIENGKITDFRWDSRNGLNTLYVSNSTTSCTTNSTFATYSTNSTSSDYAKAFTYASWMNTTVAT